MFRLVVALVALPLLGLSIVSAFFEARPQLAHAQSADEQIAAFVRIDPESMPVSPFDSSVARRTRVVDCVEAVRTLLAEGGREAVPPRLDKACLQITEAAAARAPLSSNNWLLAASFANRLRDGERTSRYLLRSYQAAPNEQWIAERRALFAYRIRDELDPALLAWLDRDFLLLLRTSLGIKALAQRFVDDPGMRDHLVALAETTEPAFQRRFLDAVRRAVRQGAR